MIADSGISRSGKDPENAVKDFYSQLRKEMCKMHEKLQKYAELSKEVGPPQLTKTAT